MSSFFVIKLNELILESSRARGSTKPLAACLPMTFDAH